MKSYSAFISEAAFSTKNISMEDVDIALTAAIENQWIPKSEYEAYANKFRNILDKERDARLKEYYKDRDAIKILDSQFTSPKAQALSNLYYDAISASSPREINALGKKLATAKKAGIADTSFYKIIEDTYNKYKGTAEKILAAKEHIKSATEIRQKAKEEEKEKETKKFEDASPIAGAAQNILEVLFRETKILKEEFLQRTAEWAKKDFARAVEMTQWPKEKWMQLYGETMYGRKYLSNKGYKIQEAVHRIVKEGLAAHIDMETKSAEQHYNDSIIKLAHRVIDKGLNPATIKAHTSKIDVNIDTTITDGHKTVRAFTIIAQGPIQKPHYRYLIK